VTFRDGATALGTASLISGTASFTISSLAVGTHSLTAAYSGDINYIGSTSGAVTQTVGPALSTIALASAPNPSVLGQPVMLTATLLGGFTPSTGSPFSVGTAPESVALADFDGDGKLDIAVADFQDNTVTVLLGTGGARFVPAAGSPFAVGREPWGLAAADLNGDGKPDLVVANHLDGTVTVLLGTGTGFIPANGSPFSVGLACSGVSIADLNHDGVPDLAVAILSNGGVYSGSVAILLGNGAGSFAAAGGSPFAWPNINPVTLAVGDFDGDGNLDLAAAGTFTGDVALMLGDGTGAFIPSATVVTGYETSSQGLTAGDFNGDGKLDLAFTSFNNYNLRGAELRDGLTGCHCCRHLSPDHYRDISGVIWHGGAPHANSERHNSGVPYSFGYCQLL
jgi:hypothetical protein